METPLRFEVEAERELEEAIRWYNEQRFCLGEQFLHEVDITVERIREFPAAGGQCGMFRRAWESVRPRSTAFHTSWSTSAHHKRFASSLSLTIDEGLGTGWIGEARIVLASVGPVTSLS